MVEWDEGVSIHETGLTRLQSPTSPLLAHDARFNVRASQVPTIVHPRPRRGGAPVSSQDVEAADLSVSQLPTKGPDLQISVAFDPEWSTETSHRSHPSVSSASSNWCSDGDSFYSRPSPPVSRNTSVDLTCGLLTSPSKFSLMSPVQAGVFEDISLRSSIGAANLDKTLPPTPVATPDQSKALKYLGIEAKSTEIAADHGRLTSPSSLRHSRSMTKLDKVDRGFSNSSLYIPRPSPVSPTLSQAEHAVRHQLSAMDKRHDSLVDDQMNERGLLEQAGPAIKRKDSIREIMQLLQRAPTIPRRSRKRDWCPSRLSTAIAGETNESATLARRNSASQAQLSACDTVAFPLRKMASVHQCRKMPVLPKSHTTNLAVDASDLEDVAEDGDLHADEEEPFSPSNDEPESAEDVLLAILTRITSLEDLANTAIINSGMYRFYKENEPQVLHAVIYNQSPAAWELQEWKWSKTLSSPISSRPNRTPRRHRSSYQSDLAIVVSLKNLILERCQIFIRRETTLALSTPSHPNAQRFNDALWRIWCFCVIFGSSKGREEDITGQLDWLKGGILANNQGCVATVNTNLDFDIASVLLNPPDFFAEANGRGLSASQLYDMTEMWSCLSVLLQGYSGRLDQARQYGVFKDQPNVGKGDTEHEEQVLEEWIAYLLTLGPDVVLDMALLATDESPAGFAFAQQKGWTTWTLPLYNGSRTNFLKEPVASMYSEQITAAKLRCQDPVEQEQKEMSRKRVASMAAEIRLRRQSSEYKRLPLIDMNTERPMSIMSRKDSVVSSRSGRSSCSRDARSCSGSSRTSSSSLWVANTRPISSIPEDRWENVDRASLPRAGQGSLASSELAVQKIVAMGFPPAVAREALRVTDDGESLRLDRAVEYLLRQQR